MMVCMHTVQHRKDGHKEASLVICSSDHDPSTHPTTPSEIIRGIHRNRGTAMTVISDAVEAKVRQEAALTVTAYFKM